MPPKRSKTRPIVPPAAPGPQDEGAEAIRRALLRWYRANHRKLPWRVEPRGDDEWQRANGEGVEPAGSPAGEGSGHPPSAIRPSPSPPSPYAVLVSEAMLQQTQVATVIPYFLRFMEAFPTVADLAAADEQRVLRLWQGLGYYRRARNLHAAAKAVIERHGGKIPGTVEELLTLPGVGRYTAGAVASIAFGVPAPIVDGNVARVWSRVFAIDEPVDGREGKEKLWALAERLVGGGGSKSSKAAKQESSKSEPARSALPGAGAGVGMWPGDFNQAVMELGATVCTPRSPKCLYCPLADLCEANRLGRQEMYPLSLPARARRAVTHVVAALRDASGRLLFERRPAQGLWSNMWQMPTLEADGKRIAPAAVRDWLRERYGIEDARPRAVGAFTHATTHRDIAFRVFVVEAADRAAAGGGVWREPGDIDDLPLSKPQLTALRMVTEPAGRSRGRRKTAPSGGGKRPRASAGRR